MNSRKLFGTVLCAIFVLPSIAAAAPAQNNDPAAEVLMTGDEGGSAPSFSKTAVDPSQCAGCCDPGCGQWCCCPRWTASADFIILDRVGSFNQTLVETVPAAANPSDPGVEALNAEDLRQGVSGGPRLGLIRHGDNGRDLELSYFQIDGWSDCRSVGPTPDDWMVMQAPGGFLQTQDHKDTQMMVWNYASRLYNAELNVRWEACCGVTMLAGFRWVNLSESLEGTLPPERVRPFWDNETRNNLYGFQIGADAKLFQRGRFSIDGVVKAGFFGNDVDETTEVSIYRIPRWESAATTHAACLSQIELQCKYQLARRLSLKFGYETIWLQGVALAPAQIPETISHIIPPVSVQAIGVDSGCNVFYHGATAGLEYVF